MQLAIAIDALEPLDTHTVRALTAVADDLSLAARRAIERVADSPEGDPIGKALAVYDILNDAAARIAAVR